MGSSIQLYQSRAAERTPFAQHHAGTKYGINMYLESISDTYMEIKDSQPHCIDDQVFLNCHKE